MNFIFYVIIYSGYSFDLSIIRHPLGERTGLHYTVWSASSLTSGLILLWDQCFTLPLLLSAHLNNKMKQFFLCFGAILYYIIWSLEYEIRANFLSPKLILVGPSEALRSCVFYLWYNLLVLHYLTLFVTVYLCYLCHCLSLTEMIYTCSWLLVCWYQCPFTLISLVSKVIIPAITIIPAIIIELKLVIKWLW